MILATFLVDPLIICSWSSNQLWKNWKISSHLSLLHVFIWPHTQGSTSTPWPDAHETMKRCPSTNDADKKTLRHVMSCHAIKFVTSCLNWYCIVRCFNHMLISLKNTCFCITTYQHILVIVAQFMLVNANGTVQTSFCGEVGFWIWLSNTKSHLSAEGCSIVEFFSIVQIQWFLLHPYCLCCMCLFINIL